MVVGFQLMLCVIFCGIEQIKLMTIWFKFEISRIYWIDRIKEIWNNGIYDVELMELNTESELF